jgi:hypothetical protein
MYQKEKTIGITSGFFMFRSYKEQITLTLLVCSRWYLLFMFIIIK